MAVMHDTCKGCDDDNHAQSHQLANLVHRQRPMSIMAKIVILRSMAVDKFSSPMRLNKWSSCYKYELECLPVGSLSCLHGTKNLSYSQYCLLCYF